MFVVKNIKGLLLFFLILLIIFLIALIFLLNTKGNLFITNPSNPDLSKIIKDISLLKNDSAIANYNKYPIALSYFRSLETKGATEQQQYNILTSGNTQLQLIYASINNPRIRTILNGGIRDYAKKYYPKLYDPVYFQTPCLDPTCQQSTHSQKLNPIIGDIKKTDFSEELKSGIIHDLTTTSYQEESTNETLVSKVDQFLIIAQGVKGLTTDTKNGSNIKIYTEIIDFIKFEYPTRYATLKEYNSALIQQ